MSSFTIVSILCFFTCVIPAAYSLIHHKNKLNILWGLFGCCGSVWAFASIIFSSTTDQNIALLWWKIGYTSAIIAPPIYLHFVFTFLKHSNGKLLTSTYIIAIFFLMLNFFYERMFLGNVTKLFPDLYWHDWLIQKNSAFLVFYLYFYVFLPLYAFAFFLKKSGNKTTEDPLFKVVMYSSIIYILPMEGLYFIDFGLFRIYPSIYNMLIAIYAATMSFCIFSHNFLNTNIFVKKSLLYSIVISSLTFGYLLIVVIIEEISRTFLISGSNTESILIVVILGFLFIPLKNKTQSYLDKALFQGSTPEIADQKNKLLTEVAQTKRIEATTVLASGIAHEIKNPLTSLRTFSEYLPQKLEDKEFLQKFSRIIGHEVNRIDNLVHELLDYAKPSPLHKKNTDINRLINETVDIFNSQYLKQNIKVSRSLDPSTNLELYVDPVKIKQVLVNLILNAIEAMPEGGELSVSSSLNKDTFQLSISDTGPGIAKEDLKYIFNPFFSKKDHGTGLGLSISRSIMKEHNGKITVRSNKGAGTTFVLSFNLEK